MRNKPSVGRVFTLGLVLCAAGTAIIGFADGSGSLFRKALVAAGLALCIGGIGVLRYLLFRRKSS